MKFTFNEWCAILDANNGAYLIDEPLAVIVWANVEECEYLDAKWGIDRKDLVLRLRTLSYVELKEILSAAGKFWKNCNLPTEEAMEIAGITPAN